MQTEIGFSGSPIFAIDNQGNKVIVGIHTHAGISNYFNSGLYFNEDIISKIYKYI